jgi:hypothetical protein
VGERQVDSVEHNERGDAEEMEVWDSADELRLHRYWKPDDISTDRFTRGEDGGESCLLHPRLEPSLKRIFLHGALAHLIDLIAFYRTRFRCEK